MKNYKKLIAWQKGYLVTKKIYALTASFPKNQQYRLADQVERASVSIISNIAEGSRRSPIEWKHYIRIALGSTSELECQLFLIKDLKLGEADICNEILAQLDEISRLLFAYIKNIHDIS